MTKRIISVVLCFMLSMSTFSALAAVKDTDAANSTIIVNETFEDCIENGTHDKAIYSKLWANGFLAEVPLGSTSERMVYSFDMLIKGGAVTGKVLNLSSSTTLFKFNENKTINLEDGYLIGGYGAEK